MLVHVKVSSVGHQESRFGDRGLSEIRKIKADITIRLINDSEEEQEYFVYGVYGLKS